GCLLLDYGRSSSPQGYCKASQPEPRCRHTGGGLRDGGENKVVSLNKPISVVIGAGLVDIRGRIKGTTIPRHTVERKFQGRKAPSTIEVNIKYHCVPSVKLLGRSHVGLKPKFDVKLSGGPGRQLVLAFLYSVGSAHSLPKAEYRCKNQVVDVFAV